MSEQLWYIYQQTQQLGPFGPDQVTQLIENSMVSKEAYLFRVGWKDWRPLEDCYEELGMDRKGPPATPKRRAGAPRAGIMGRVIVHNNGQLAIGTGVNISTTGIFVETKDEIFTVGEKLKLSVRCDGLKKPFNVVAQVIRFNVDPNCPVGYGLKFEDIDPAIASEIEVLVRQQNVAKLSEAGVS